MKKKIIVSGMITLLLLIVFVFTGPVYSFAGDGSIAKYLASNAEPGFNSVSWGIGAFLKIFVKLFPSVNWWTMFSIFMMFSSLFFLTLFIQELFDGIKGSLIAVVFALFLWEAAYSIDINFTQTAILSGITGTSAVLMMSRKKVLQGRILYGIIGLLYILIAGSLRFDAMIMCIPFAIVIIAIRLLLLLMNKTGYGVDDKTDKNDKRSDFVRVLFSLVITPVIVILCTVVLSYGVHQVYRHMNPNIAFFEDTFDLTREVYDYLDMYPEYDEVKDVYEAAGLKSSWYAMLTNYYIADTNYFNVETMSVPVQFKGASTKTFGGYMSEMMNYKGALILGALVIILAGILTSVRKSILPLMSAIVVFVVSGLYFVHVGRYAWRVSGGVTVACVVMGLMMLVELLAYNRSYLNLASVNSKDNKNKLYERESISINESTDSREKNNDSVKNNNEKNDNKSKTLIHNMFRYSKLTDIVGISITIMILACVGMHIATTKSFALPKSEVTDKAKADLLDYMDSNSDIIYFTEDYDYASHNIWYVGAPGYLDNKFTTLAGYNEGRKSDLQAVGISDMSQFVINMLTRSDIYTEYSDVWTSYLCDYYNPYVSAGIVDVYEPTGTQFIRYVAPVEATEDKYDDTVTDVSLYVDSNKQSDNYQIIHIDARTSALEDGIEYYMNVENAVTGAIYSYPLVREGDALRGDAIWKNDTWSFMDTSQYIVARYPDGHVVRILNITGTPVPFL
ncbi:hypothetical protein [Butyrivibrio fibrisolvens]|uniref:hypothetical protein n=1 Tax=Butyrivibrio fibrisolvens TaxID=831 RepID=UPI00048488D5|nr:hypothetical protein [Butyrivibrio fibrisolvens]